MTATAGNERTMIQPDKICKLQYFFTIYMMGKTVFFRQLGFTPLMFTDHSVVNRLFLSRILRGRRALKLQATIQEVD